MGKKGIVIWMGLGLILTGIILAAPVFANLLAAFLKGYGWVWSPLEAVMVIVGGIAAVMGFAILFSGLNKRAGFRVSIVIILVIIVGVGSVMSYRQVVTSFNEAESNEEIVVNPAKAIAVEVPYNSNTAEIAEVLKKNRVINNTLLFRFLSKINGYDGTFQAGTHIVSKDLNYDKLMRVLADKPKSKKVTIPEGLTYKQIVEKLEKQKLITSSKFYRTANFGDFDFKYLKEIPEREYRLEGYLFPDTYEFNMKASEKNVVQVMLDNFSKKFKPEYEKKAKELGMTVDQVITLASIIEREASSIEDRKLISRVFYKRLNSKDSSMRKLQSCATIQYIYLNKEGTVKKKITYKDTEIDDPFNTYKYEKLPPGPICSPGIDSIEAALYPADDMGYWYFIARGDGTTEFSKTYSQHLAAQRKYGF